MKVKEGQVKMELVGRKHTDICERACLEGGGGQITSYSAV